MVAEAVPLECLTCKPSQVTARPLESRHGGLILLSVQTFNQGRLENLRDSALWGFRLFGLEYRDIKPWA